MHRILRVCQHPAPLVPTLLNYLIHGIDMNNNYSNNDNQNQMIEETKPSIGIYIIIIIDL